MSTSIIGGLRVIIVPDWPREVVDHEAARDYDIHPVVKWLARWFPIRPYVEYQRSIYRDADPQIHKGTSSIFCSPAQAEALKRRSVQ